MKTDIKFGAKVVALCDIETGGTISDRDDIGKAKKRKVKKGDVLNFVMQNDKVTVLQIYDNIFLPTNEFFEKHYAIQNNVMFKAVHSSGDKDKKPAQWQYFGMLIFFIPSVITLILGSLLFKITDLLLFGTHHFKISCQPKEH